MKYVVAIKGTENAASSCANNYDIMNEDSRHIFSMLEICNKCNNFFFKKLKFFIQCICLPSLHLDL